MKIISRETWNARRPKKPLSYVHPSRRTYFVVHHSGGPVDQAVRIIQNWCIDGRGFNDIDYNFLVRGDTGEIYEGRGWDAVGAHTTNYNTTGVGVCVIGTDEISDKAKESVRWLYEQYTRRCGKALAMKGHRDLATTGTSCPGNRIYAWVKAGMPAMARNMGSDVSAQDVIEALKSPEGQDAIKRALMNWTEINPDAKDPKAEAKKPTWRVGGAIRFMEQRANARHNQVVSRLDAILKKLG